MKSRTTLYFIEFISLLSINACTSNPSELAKQFAETYNTSLVNEIVSFYADDAVFIVAGALKLKGKDQIRRLTQYDSVMNTNMAVNNIETRDDTVFCNLTETNDWHKTAGIGETHYKMKLVFNRGLITYLYAEGTPETQKALGQVYTSLLQWASIHMKDELSEMMPNGEFLYSAENARKFFVLLKVWKEREKE